MARGIALVTCFALVERCLRIVDEHYDRELSRAQRIRRRNGGKIALMLQAFEETTGARIELSPSAEGLLQTERRLRNCFAHGDWDGLEDLPGVSYCDLLVSAAEIFRAIEDVYARSE